MARDIDDLLAEIRSIAAEIETGDIDTTAMADLTARRDELRSEAQSLAGELRHPRSVETEIAMLRERLAEIDETLVGKGYAEKHLTKGFSDPGAYSANINRKIASHHADEVEAIRRRLDRLMVIEQGEDED